MISGYENVIFGGEGLFITTLTGPSTVWLQGQPPQRMISEIACRVPSGGGTCLSLEWAVVVVVVEGMKVATNRLAQRRQFDISVLLYMN